MKYNNGDWRLTDQSFLDDHMSIDIVGGDTCTHYCVANVAVRMNGQTENDEIMMGNAKLMTGAKDLYEALDNVHKLISEAAKTGFNCHGGDWAERLFESQQQTSRALIKVRGKL